MAITNLLSEFRKWLDGDEAAVLQPAAEAKPQPRRELEEFLVSIAREIEAVMQREMFTPPGGPTYIPREYLVFLSREDDAQWQGDKREGLQRGLFHVLSERAGQLAGEHALQTKSFAVELRVDGTLEKGKFRVQPVWDSSSPKTEIKPRKRPDALPASVAPAAEVAEAAESEATIVRPRNPLFTLEYTLDGVSDTFKAYQNQISIGRGSKDFLVDLKLKDDLEVSRKHATLNRDAEGAFTLTCEGRNPVELDTQEINQGETVALAPGQSFKIGKYSLKVI